MEDLRGKVAVVTGAASGIGLALARQACMEGMNVVLADIDRDGLRTAAGLLQQKGVHVESVPTDVGDAESVESLCRACYKAFDSVDLLCNNAGIITSGDVVSYAWDTPMEEWQRMVQVNLWGVINGCRSFIPRMLQQGREGWILNTASSAGLVAGTGAHTVYRLTKHAIVSLTENLSKQLAAARSKIKAAVLCPGMVATSIAKSAFKGVTAQNEVQRQKEAEIRSGIDSGSDAGEIAAKVFRAFRAGQLYIVPHARTRELVRTRFEAIMAAFDAQAN